MEQVLLALQTAAGMLWKAFWALVFGYIVSAAIQVMISRKQMGRALGERGIERIALAGFLGTVSSSCSFAALATSRSVLVKGAHPVNAVAFLVASTNLVVELGVVLFVLLGWEFFVGNLLLGVLIIVYVYLLTACWFPGKLAKIAREHAGRTQEADGSGRDGQGDERSWRLLASNEGWEAIADAFVMEWKMVYKEILFGFTVAGFISVFVPVGFWDSLFLESGADAPSFLAVLENALVAPLVAFFTFIGSMGNVPLAAMLWSKNSSFGGVMAFLGADLVAATVVWVHAKYYGWRYAMYLSALLYVGMVAAGVSVHYLFAAVGRLPTTRPSLEEMVRFEIDYTFWLDVAFGLIGGILLYLHCREKRESR